MEMDRSDQEALRSDLLEEKTMVIGLSKATLVMKDHLIKDPSLKFNCHLALLCLILCDLPIKKKLLEFDFFFR
jgi:hypothetical protein